MRFLEYLAPVKSYYELQLQLLFNLKNILVNTINAE